MSIKTPITYYGGKQTLLRHILPLIPDHVSYTEAFAGGAAVFWAKEPARVETINDVNGNLVNFYRVLKTGYSALKCLVDQTLHSRKEHEFAQIVYEFPEFFDPVRRAWAVWVLSKLSFASKLDGTFGLIERKIVLLRKFIIRSCCLPKHWRKGSSVPKLSARMPSGLSGRSTRKIPFTSLTLLTWAQIAAIIPAYTT
jgi:DNA adenine methylase